VPEPSRKTRSTIGTMYDSDFPEPVPVVSTYDSPGRDHDSVTLVLVQGQLGALRVGLRPPPEDVSTARVEQASPTRSLILPPDWNDGFKASHGSGHSRPRRSRPRPST
jgi:hypothetical protein